MIEKVEDLLVWQEARILNKEVYLITAKFPKDEEYNIKKHLKQCSRNIPGNIAEGFGRYHYQESMQFYRIARGSLNELKSDLYLSFDLEYINKEELSEMLNRIDNINKMLNSLIKNSFKSKNNNQ